MDEWDAIKRNKNKVIGKVIGSVIATAFDDFLVGFCYAAGAILAIKLLW